MRMHVLFLALVGAVMSSAAWAACGESDLAISLSDVADPAIAGSMLSYELTVDNLDAVNSACGVQVVFDPPNDSTFIASTGCDGSSPGTPTCSLGQIDPSTQRTVFFQVTVDPDAGSQLLAMATVSSTTNDPESNNDTDNEETSVAYLAALSLSATADRNPVIAGDLLTYTLTVTNGGPSDADDVEVTVALPSQVQFLNTVGCADDPNGVPLCRLQTVRAGMSEVIMVRVNVDADVANTFELNAVVVSSTADDDASDNNATVASLVSLEERIGAGSAPSIAADPDASGSFVVVWQQQTPTPPESQYRRTSRSEGQRGSSAGPNADGIVARVFDSLGMPVGIELRLDSSGSSLRSADVTSYDSGQFVAVWEGQDSDGEGVFARRFDSLGMPVGIELQINESSDLLQGEPMVAGLPGGGFGVVWVHEDSLGSFIRSLRLFDSGGMPVGIETQFGAPVSTINPPSLAANSSGLLATWADASNRVVSQLFDSGGMPVGIETFVSESGTNSRPRVAPQKNGGFVVVWQNEEGGGDGADILARRIDSIGMPVGIETQINGGGPGNRHRPAIATAVDGSFAVTWQGPDADGTGIFAQRLDPLGMPVGIETRHSLTNEGNQEASEPAFVDKSGTFYVAWQSDDAGESNIVISPPNALFLDGFESGDFEAWFSTSPTP